MHPVKFARNILAGALLSAMLVLVPAVSAGPVVAAAHAQPDDVANPPGPPGVTLPWRDLGLSAEVHLAPNSSHRVTVSVPVGLNAVRLLGNLSASNIDAGSVEVTDRDGRPLAVIDLPPGASGRPATPFDVDISPAARSGSSIELSFTARPQFDPQHYAGQFCEPHREVVLRNLSTLFTGSEAPVMTIAGFFPPVLRETKIYTPVDADVDEQQAALTLVGILAQRYHNQPTDITVVRQPRGATPPPAGDLTRTVLVERSDNTGLEVENPGTAGTFLRVSGSGGELSTQLSLYANKLQALAQTDVARVDTAGSSEADPSGDTMSFGELNMTGSTEISWIDQLSVGVDRTSLGSGRVDGARVHLLADYTPVTQDDSAAVVIRSGGAVVYRALLGESGRLDATFDLDSRDIGQYLGLEMAFTYRPHQPCGSFIAPISFDVDPRSTLTVHRGGPPLGGFGAVPSEFSPSFMVAMDGSGPKQLPAAARLVASIARSASRPLTPQVVDVATAAGAGSGALILANSEALSQTELQPPISGDGSVIDLALPTALRADIKGGLGSIQAFADQPRDRSVILVTTTGPWTLVDPLFDYLDGVGGDLSRLNGDVLVAGVAGDPTNISVRSPDNISDTAKSPHSLSRSVLIGTGLAVVATIGAFVAVLWSRRRRSTEVGPSND